jgi:hypothetical protein
MLTSTSWLLFLKKNDDDDYYYYLPKQLDPMLLMTMGLFFPLQRKSHSFKSIYKRCGQQWGIFFILF